MLAALLFPTNSQPTVEEAINDPANNCHYWRWRMEPYLETLLDDKKVLSTSQKLHWESGRAVPSQQHIIALKE
jgi:4-alpha-glucanotransferase